ncbi:MAG: ABC transporter permease [Acidobacteriota bacterium]
MTELARDLRHSARLLVKNPIFTTIAVLSLALGIGANTAVFTLANTLLLRPLPVRDPGRLVRLSATDKEGNTGAFAYPDYVDYRNQNHSFSGLLAHSSARVGVNTGQGEPEIVFGEVVSENYFDVLGATTAFGRTFLPDEGRAPGKSPVVVLSDSFWRRRLAGSPGAVGSSVRINGNPFTVIGIAPAGFQGTLEGGVLPSSFWIPSMMYAQVGTSDITLRNSVGFELVGRLRAGVTVETAQSEMSGLARNLEQAYPDDTEFHFKKRLVQLVALRSVLPSMHGIVVALMSFLMGVVGLVLLTACTNLANMLLVRMSTRARELATRLALGARRGALIRQLLVESLLLAVMGGVLGLFLAYLTVRGLTRIHLPTPVPIQFDLAMDWRVLAFCSFVSVLTVVLFGLIPALQATRLSPATVLKENTGGESRSGNKLRKIFVVAQLSISMLLLIFSGLLLRSLTGVNHIDPGFQVDNGLAVSLDLGVKKYQEDDGLRFFDGLYEQVRALPGVRGASLAGRIPLTSGNSTIDVQLAGSTDWSEIDTNLVDAEYFKTMAIAMLQGREFSVRDDRQAPRAVVVSKAMAERLWPGAQALGQRLSIRGDEGAAEVVGVAADGNYRTLEEAPRPHIYRALRQEYDGAMILLVRTTADPQRVIPQIREAVHRLDQDLPLYGVTTLREHVDASVLPARMAAILLGILGLLTLGLAGIGIYGVMAYSVGQRTHEIGIRVSVGAQQGDILKMLLVQGGRLVLIGIGIGIVLALALTRFASSLLYGVSSTDPLTFLGIAALLAIISLFAVFLPARRAMRLDPQTALRRQ